MPPASGCPCASWASRWAPPSFWSTRARSTAPAHRQPNQRAADAATAWGYPEGYLIDRLYLCARAAFAKEHPDLLVAFLRARIEAQRLAVANQPKALEVANEWWKLDPAVAAQSRDTYPENTNIRNAPFVLEFDALGIIKGSEFFASINTIDGPVTWAELKPVLMPAAEMQKRAWEAGGSRPTIAEMESGLQGLEPDVAAVDDRRRASGLDVGPDAEVGRAPLQAGAVHAREVTTP